MEFPELLKDTRIRFRNPWIWSVLLALYLPSGLHRFVQAPRLNHPIALLHLFLPPFIGLALFAWVAPWAWLWDGRPGTYPSPVRGIAQGIGLGSILGLLYLGFAEGLASITFGTRMPWGTLPLGLLQIALGSTLVGFLIVALERAVRAREEAERMARQAQWILLKGQMHPHVFFNAINNLTELIRKDPVRAERAAMDLGVLFRRLMDHGQCHVAPLEDERKLVESYLAMEALRFGDRLRIAWEWDSALDPRLVPPFLLQPLVENALKHGLGPHPAGGTIRISGREDKGRIRLRVENDGCPLSGTRGRGAGLPNLEGRLRLAYSTEAGLTLTSEGPRTVAEVVLPAAEEMA